MNENVRSVGGLCVAALPICEQLHKYVALLQPGYKESFGTFRGKFLVNDEYAVRFRKRCKQACVNLICERRYEYLFADK